MVSSLLREEKYFHLRASGIAVTKGGIMTRTMILFVLMFLVVVCGALYAIAADALEGTYSVVGWNPGQDTKTQPSYTGIVSIKKIDSVYELDWKIGQQHHGGVGFYYEDTKRLAVAYSELSQCWFGEVVYTVEGKTLNGVWTVYGDKAGKLGKEVLTKQG